MSDQTSHSNNSETLRLRPATEDDKDAITHLWRERMTILAQSDPRFLPYLARPQTDRIMGSSGPTTRFVAEKSGKVIGYIAGAVHDGMGRIDAMALDAHTYHGGAGRSLVNTFRAWLEEHQIETLAVHVPRFHPVEQAFWRSLGANEWDTTDWPTPPEMTWMKL